MPLENQSENTTPLKNSKKKISFLSIITFLCFCVPGSILTFLVFTLIRGLGGEENLMTWDMEEYGTTIAIAIALTAFIAIVVPILGTVTLIKIYRSNNKLKGKLLVVIPIVISLLVSMPIRPIFETYILYLNNLVCETNIWNFGKAIGAYADRHDGMMPDPNNWCDILIDDGMIDAEEFVCLSLSDAKYGESSYAMNTEAAGKKLSELPKDMVLIFEAKFDPARSKRDFPITSRPFTNRLKKKIFDLHKNDKVYEHRWNLAGGPELITPFNHDPNGSNILFVEGCTSPSLSFEGYEFVNTKDFHKLRWYLEEDKTLSGDFFEFDKKLAPKNNFVQIFIYIVLALLVVVTAIILLLWAKSFLLFAMVIPLLAAGISFFFIFLDKSLYMENNFPPAFRIAAVILTFVVSLCYVKFIKNTPAFLKQQKKSIAYAVSLGMAAGIIIPACLSLIFLFFFDQMGSPIIALICIILTIPLGAFVGTILGYLSGHILKKMDSTKQSV